MRSDTESAGYITELEYTGHFYPFLAPARLAYTAAINGYRAPAVDDFTWCELGCGKGITPLVLAAVHPRGRFFACDLNPAHVEHGEALRRAAGVDNLRLYAASIRQMLDEPLPRFDYIVLHGVYGWVPGAVREEIHAFVSRFLKPGGLLFVSYNALPGWAHIEPLREMMRFLAAGEPGDAAQRAQRALARLKALADMGAGFFRDLPAAAAHVEDMARRDVPYLAHEYLTPHGSAFHLAEVARAMAACGLAYAGSAIPRHNYAELMAPARFGEVLAGARSRIELETLRDFIVNTAFRRDVYAAQPDCGTHGAARSLAAFDGIHFGLADLPEKLPLRAAESAAVAFDLEGERAAVEAVHALLMEGPAGAPAIAEALGRPAPEAALAFIQKLVVAGHLDPCPPCGAGHGWPRVNDALLEAALRARQPRLTLASPRAGSGFDSDTVHGAAIAAALSANTPDDAAQAFLAQLRRTSQRVFREGAAGRAETVNDAELGAYAAELCRSLQDGGGATARHMRLLGLLA